MSETFVALDVEATGMDPTRHEVIEVAVVVSSREAVQERYSTLVRPRGRLSLDIAALTGITAQELRAAPTFPEVAGELRRLLDGRPLVGHSVGLDAAMLAAAGLPLPNPVYDTYQLATLLLPDLPAYGLAAVARRLGIADPGGHRAAPDAEAAAAVFRALLARLDEHDPSTLAQAASLARAAGWAVAPLFEAAAVRGDVGPLFERPVEDGRRGPHELAFLTPRERPEALRPTGSRKAVDPARVRAALAPGGALSRVVPRYEHRPQQEEMAVAVARAFGGDDRLLVEAGTGTGKSVAYLLPAALHAVERGETVVVSTNTLALQDQLFRKDIPDLRRALAEGLADGDDPVPFEASVLKGRANYLCLRRWFASNRQPTHDAAEAALRAKVLLWLGETETGDRAELRLESDEEPGWRGLSAEGEGCTAARCVYQQRNQCFLMRARRRAEHAHLVVVNHALLLSDVVAGSRVLPEYAHLVVDEAHHLEEQATSQFGFSVDGRMLSEYLDGVIRREGPVEAGTAVTVASFLTRVADDDASRRRAAASLDRAKLALDAAEEARAAGRTLFARLDEFLTRYGSDGGGYDRTVRLTDAVRHDGAWAEVELVWDRLDRQLRDLDGHLRWFADAVERYQPSDDPDDPDAQQHADLEGEVATALRTGADVAARLQSTVGTPNAASVYWLERSPLGDRTSLHSAPLHVADVLQDQLFAPLDAAVMTSATITTDGTFDYVASRLGLEDAATLAVASPFDYQRSTLLYLADDIPEPNAPGYQRALQATLVELCDATRGRALVLFTSHSALQATYRAIKRPLEDVGVLVLAQRTDGSPRQLIERLRHTPNVVVLGTATFWEGVDVVGPALSLLAITKLPFAVPSDPVFAARSELFERPFPEYAVPQAVLKFKQGFGRLIRSSRDRGVCAVLDRRVLSKRYGRSFVESLPECTVSVGSTQDLPAAASDWLAGEGWAF